MTLPAPLPIAPEQLIVVEIVDGYAVTDFVHLPAKRAVEYGAGGPLFSRYEFPPSRWPSACRELKSGSLYVRAGEFAGAEVCAACLAAVA